MATQPPNRGNEVNNEQRIGTYREFWPFHLNEHRQKLTRQLHFVGTALLFPLLGAALLIDPRWWFALPLTGYGFACASHFFVEKNRPATFKYPLWSLLSDFRMFFMICRGTLAVELEKAKISANTEIH